jgi:DNA invertase Pin-like site-specific DNA recombinase
MRGSWRDSTLTHGGKRAGAGRPPKDISVSRVYSLYNSGVTMKEIARRFNVSAPVISRLIKAYQAIKQKAESPRDQ